MQCMARKRNNKQRKLEPAVQTLAFTVPTAGVGQGHTVDLSQAASLVNRRFYRQGINWVVSGFRFFRAGTAPTAGTGVAIGKLPNTWVMANAWEKGFRHWQELNKRAIEAGESLPGRFTDFKVYMDATHHQAVQWNLLPTDADATPAAAGEWVYSKIILPDTTITGNAREREIIAVGGN